MTRIWTIGHSTYSSDEFIALLAAHGLEALADVRRFPGSRRHAQFNRDQLAASLESAGIAYHWFEALGGRRSARPDSRNTAWSNAGFRGYADYMETAAFRGAADELLALAKKSRTAMMCAEAYWRRCHRALLSDYLKAAGLEVIHILDRKTSEPHPFTQPAFVADGRLSYVQPSATQQRRFAFDQPLAE